MKRVRKAVIPVAGLGTRFLPITKTIPKELLPIGTKPTLQLVIEEAVGSGIEEIVLVTTPRKAQISSYFTSGGEYERMLKKTGKLGMLNSLNSLLKKIRITEAIQDSPKGLGHAVLCAKKAVGDEPFIVQLPDEVYDCEIPCTKQLIDLFQKISCSLNATQKTPRHFIHLYGIHDIASSDGRVHKSNGVVEKPSPEKAPSDLCVAGRYLLTPEIFDVLEKTPPDKDKEIQLAEALNTMAKRGKLYAYEFKGKRFDTGDKLGYIKANVYFGCKDFPDEMSKFCSEVKNEFFHKRA